MKSAKLLLPAMAFMILVSTITYAQHDGKASGDYQRLLSWMTGSFTSLEQSQTDSSYFDIRLHMAPIWPERSDAFWLYVEQAVVDYTDQPYRQRVYRLTQLDDSTFESAVFTFKEPLRFAGAWRAETPLAELTTDSLTKRQGCSIILKKRGNSAFVGSTVEKKCESSLRGAAYATSEVDIAADELVSWDRGFDSEDNQVWGAEKGGYIFKRIATINEAKIIASLKEDMVKFDRAYIPALALTDQGKLDESIQAVRKLHRDWEKLKNKYYNVKMSHPDWKVNLDALGALIELSDSVISLKHDLFTTHNLLEKVKLSCGYVRQQYSIDYYIDYLSNFHETMAGILTVARGKKPVDLTDEDIDRIKELYPEAMAKWKTVTDKRFEERLFGFEEGKVELMQDYLGMESFALEKLGQALEGDDRQQILQAVVGIKPNFAKLYKLFGDFSGLN